MYCTTDDIISAVAESKITKYTDDAGEGLPDVDVMEKAIASATAMIESYISGRYGSGLDPVPDLIRTLAVDISIYKIASRTGDAPETFRDAYLDALGLLKRISDGKADIPGVAVTDDTAAAVTSAAVVTRPGVYTKDGLEGY